MSYQRVDVHVFEGLNSGVGADVGSHRIEDGAHVLYSRGVVAVHSFGGGALGLAGLQCWGLGADEVGAGGDDDGVARAGVLVEIEGGGDFGAAVDHESAVGLLELVVSFLGGGFGFGGVSFGVEKRAVDVEVGEVGVFVEGDPVALDLLHAVVGDDE